MTGRVTMPAALASSNSSTCLVLTSLKSVAEEISPLR